MVEVDNGWPGVNIGLIMVNIGLIMVNHDIASGYVK